MTTADAGAQAPPHVNGTAPAAGPDPDCAECVTKGEIGLAVLGAAIGGFIIVMAVDLGTGGRIAAMFGLGPRAGVQASDNSGT